MNINEKWQSEMAHLFKEQRNLFFQFAKINIMCYNYIQLRIKYYKCNINVIQKVCMKLDKSIKLQYNVKRIKREQD